MTTPSPSLRVAGRWWRALRARNYRLFFAGQFLSLVGTWMTNTATAWLVFRLTKSAWMLGVVGFAGHLPAVFLTPLAGLLVDRWDRRRLLMATQVLSMIQSLALAALTLSGTITIPILIGLHVLGGVVTAFDTPCRQALLVSLIEKREDLGNAIALNSSSFNLARLIGPAAGGLVIAAVGEGWCFLIDGLSFMAVLAALNAMGPLAVRVRASAEMGLRAQWREGWHRVRDSEPIRSILGLLAWVSLVGFPYTVLVPVVAGSLPGGGPHALGFLLGASGAGAVAGALWMAGRSSTENDRALLPRAVALFSLGLVGFSATRSLVPAVLALVVTSMGSMVQLAASNTILQHLVEDEKRGRVMSFFLLAFFGTAPFGSLLAGRAAEYAGAPMTLRVQGLLCLLGALWFARRPGSDQRAGA
jgi:MFS family permease